MNDDLLRRAGRLYGRVRNRLASAAYRAQLGPSRETDWKEYSPGRTWHNHRSI